MFFSDSYKAMRRGQRALAVRYLVISVLVILLILLPAAFFMLRRFEAASTFQPQRAAWGGEWKTPSGAEEVWFKTADGVRLHGWYFRAGVQPGEGTVIFFHGNGGNLSYCDWVGEQLARRGFDVLLFDYRGYGRSEGEPVGERELYADADAAYDFVVRERGADPRRIALYGQSLGTAAAVDLAARKACGALVVESGLASAADMAGVVMPFLPGFVRGLTKNKFDSKSKLARVGCPVFVAHGDRDEIIPASQGQALFDAATGPKQLKVVKGAGHNDLSIVGGRQYIDTLAEFIRGSFRKN
jgi:hypothetical protein